jgi:ribonuclease P protein subunit RPR2
MTIAEERVERLESLASEAASAGDDELAREYVRLARRIAERHRLRLPRSLRWFACDACDRYLVPGANARVRTGDGHVVITCDCGTQSRHPYGD